MVSYFSTFFLNDKYLNRKIEKFLTSLNPNFPVSSIFKLTMLALFFVTNIFIY